MKLTDFPQEIIDEYNLNDIVNSNGWIYIKIRKALPGLCQSGTLAAKKASSRSETICLLHGPYP